MSGDYAYVAAGAGIRVIFLGGLGDVNGDGGITIVDALLVARKAVGLSSDIEASAADVNCDGSITIVDALLIARKSVGLEVTAWCGGNGVSIEP